MPRGQSLRSSTSVMTCSRLRNGSITASRHRLGSHYMGRPHQSPAARIGYVYHAVAFRWRQLQRRRTPPSEYGNRLQLDLQADFYRQHPERLRSDLAVFASQLHEMASAAGDTRLLVVTLPSWRQMDEPSDPTRRESPGRTRTDDRRRSKTRWARLYRRYADPESGPQHAQIWPVERHLNDTGHALLADAIFQALVGAVPPIAHDETREPR